MKDPQGCRVVPTTRYGIGKRRRETVVGGPGDVLQVCGRLTLRRGTETAGPQERGDSRRKRADPTQDDKGSSMTTVN